MNYSSDIFDLGDLRLSGSIIRKSRFIFTKERRMIRQKNGCLNHSNERNFPGKHPDAGADQGFLERGFICIKDVGLSHLYLIQISHENEIIWFH